MPEIAFLTADVFTDRPFGGNPLAVFPDAAGLDDKTMQIVARELNLSETVFVLPPEQPGHTRRLRIFTPAMELPFAGHPTVGTAVLLAETGVLDASDIVFGEGAGPVPVRIARTAAGTTATLTSPRPPILEAPAPDRAALARVLTLPPDALATVAEAGVYSAGTPFTIVPLRDEAALAAARVDIGAWGECLAGTASPHLFVVTMADWTAGRDVRARMFAPAMGIAEDPATGAAAAALARFLIDLQHPADGRADWIVVQGVEMGRRSTILVGADVVAGEAAAVRIGGTAVRMSQGTFRLPDAR